MIQNAIKGKKMTPPELEFSSLEIFNAFRESQELVCPGECDSNDALAIVLNRILAEKVARCPKVYATKNPCTGWAAMEASPLVDNFPYTARLVEIKEIEK